MERRRIRLTTIICLITFFGIIAGAGAETIHIDGPWLWMIAPPDPANGGGAASINFDSLDFMSGNEVTEEMIATHGANVGDFVGNLQWAPGTISVIRPGFFDFGNGNINDCLEKIGFIKGNVDHATSYALVNIYSAIDQEVTMRVGSDDAIKVWLNGRVVHTNIINRSSTDYQENFLVDLKARDNLLMVKVSEKEKKWRMFVGLHVPNPDSIVFTLPENVNIDTENVVDAGSEPQVEKEPLRNSFEYHDWSLPEDILTDVAVIDGVTYFVWKPNTPVPDSNSIPYKSILTLDLPKTIKDYVTARQLYNLRNLPSEYPYLMVPLPTKTPTEAAEDADQIFTWWSVIKSFFRNIWASLPTIEDETIDALDQLYPKLRINLFFTATQVIYATTQEALENYRTEKSAFNLITIALQNPSITVEEFSQFMLEDMVNNNSEARYLVMVPEPLKGLTMRMETYYYHQNATGGVQDPLLIRGDTRGGDMHLFWSSSNGRIRLNVPNKSHHRVLDWFPENSTSEYWDLTLRQLLTFWAKGFGQHKDHNDFWDTWNSEWKGNDDTISIDDKAYITKQFLGTLKVWERLTLGHITLRTLFDVFDTNSDPLANFATKTLGLDLGVFTSKPHVFMFLPKYEEVPTYPIVTHHKFQFQAAVAEAPLARPMSLADYPPFQELAPEVQALLLAYFENTTRPEASELDRNPIPEQTALLSNFPNPFNPETWIPYQLAEPADVALTIYAVDGSVVRTLALGHQPVGIYQDKSRAAYWDGRNAQGEPVASGVYFYTLKAGEFSATRKMLIQK